MNAIIAPQIARLRSLSLRNPDHEICGYLTRGLGVIPLKNTAPDPTCQFRLSRRAEQALEAAVTSEGRENVYVYHSHPSAVRGASEFSTMDIANLDATKYKGVLIHTPTGCIREYDPLGLPPLLRRRWVTSHQNCYTLIRDWYRQQRGITLGRHYLTSTAVPQTAGWNLFEEAIAAEGFSLVTDGSLETGDLALFRIGRTVNSNHIGVISDAQRNRLLHHPGELLSLEEDYSALLKRVTYQVWRWADGQPFP